MKKFWNIIVLHGRVLKNVINWMSLILMFTGLVIILCIFKWIAVICILVGAGMIWNIEAFFNRVKERNIKNGKWE